MRKRIRKFSIVGVAHDQLPFAEKTEQLVLRSLRKRLFVKEYSGQARQKTFQRTFSKKHLKELVLPTFVSIFIF